MGNYFGANNDAGIGNVGKMIGLTHSQKHDGVNSAQEK